MNKRIIKKEGKQNNCCFCESKASKEAVLKCIKEIRNYTQSVLNKFEEKKVGDDLDEF